jgi:hypothetical protein
MGGGWFWWGSNSCTPSEYKQQLLHTPTACLTKKFASTTWCGDTRPMAATRLSALVIPRQVWWTLMGVDIYDFEDDNEQNPRQHCLRAQPTAAQFGRSRHHSHLPSPRRARSSSPTPSGSRRCSGLAVERLSHQLRALLAQRMGQPQRDLHAYPGGPMEQDSQDLLLATGRTLFVTISIKKDRNQKQYKHTMKSFKERAQLSVPSHEELLTRANEPLGMGKTASTTVNKYPILTAEHTHAGMEIRLQRTRQTLPECSAS